MRRFLYIFICIAAIFVMTIYDLYAAFLMAVMLILAPLLSILPMYWIRKRLRLSIKVPARLLRGHLALVLVDIEQRHLGAVRHEVLRHRVAETGGAAGDDRLDLIELHDLVRH